MIDGTVIASYFLIILYVGLKSGRKIKTIVQYTIGERNFSTTTLVATLTATLIGGGATFGLAEKTIKFGLIFPVAYCGICVSRYLEAVFISKRMKPFFGLISAGDIMEKLYGKHAKILTGIATLTTSIFILGAHITAMGFLLESLLGIPLNISLVVGTLTVIIYSGYGGISAVSFTDVAQLIFMLVAIPTVCILGLIDVGGFSAIKAAVPISHLDFRDLDLNTLMDHWAIFISYALPALFPVVIQRMLMSKNEQQIKSSMLLNGVLSATFFFLVALIGLIVMTKAPGSDPKLAFPFLIKEVLPIGLRGLAIAGLLAVIMSTVDSFLNLIGVAITHDILHPIIGKKLTEEKQLSLARITGCLAGIVGLISALYFNGILENVFASMNLWIPYIFPPLFLGILRQRYSPKAFFIGLIAAFSTSMVIKYLGILPGFSGILLAALMNSVSILLITRKTIDINADQNGHALKINQFNNHKYKIFAVIKTVKYNLIKLTKNNINVFEIFSVFILCFSTLPILVSTGMGNLLSPLNLCVNATIAVIAVLILFNDIWAQGRLKHALNFLWPILLITTLSIQPVLAILSFHPTLFLFINLLSGWVILYLFSNEKMALSLVATGIFSAICLHLLSTGHNLEPSNTRQVVETLVKFLALAYFFFDNRRRDAQKIRDYDSLSGTMAHEIAHSITSMNFAAKRLKKTLHSNMTESSMKDLENLAERLEHDANYANNAIRIIQTKFGINPTQNETTKFGVLEAITEAINSTFIQNITEKITIKISEGNFDITADKGSIVHVFINLIKNSSEAVCNTSDASILISIIPVTNTVELIDNGSGMSPMTLSKIFDENFTTKAHGKGKGLYFCKFVLDLFGGTITCKSQPGRTIFTIQFLNLPTEKDDDPSHEKEDSSAFS